MLRRALIAAVAMSSTPACHHSSEPGPSQPWSSNSDFQATLDELRAAGVVRARTGAAPCAEGDIGGCDAACTAGSGWACTSAGDAVSDDLGRTARLYQRACDLHDADGCAALALLGIADHREMARDPFATLYEACVQGSVRACHGGRPLLYERAKWGTATDSAADPMYTVALDMAHRGCALGNASDCQEAGDWQILCDRGDATGCQVAADQATRAAAGARVAAEQTAEAARIAALSPEARAAEEAAMAAAYREQGEQIAAARRAEAAASAARAAASAPSTASTAPASTPLSVSACHDMFVELCVRGEVRVRNHFIAEHDADVEHAVLRWRVRCIDGFMKDELASCQQVRCGEHWKACALRQEDPDDINRRCVEAQNDC